MTYDEMINYIDDNFGYGTIPGLDRVKNILNELDNPQEQLKIIHVAGTNGKGSTVATLSSILSNAGYKTGMYISPHLFTMRERMVIDGVMISEEDMVMVCQHVLNKVEVLKTKNLEIPTHFELITAIAFYYFYLKKVDVLVLEVGLGGRYDATNVINPILSVITSISLDHTDFLGDTIEKVAGEKAGIVKMGIPTILYPQRFEEARKVVEAECIKNKSELIQVEKCFVSLKGYHDFLPVISYDSYLGQIEEAQMNLIGEHQLLNTATAITALLKLKKMGYPISYESIKSGLSQVVWPCRFTIVSKEPLVIIDGAHNSDGVDALKATLEKQFGTYKIIGITGMLGDKDYAYAVKEMSSMMERCYTLTPNSPRALDKAILAEVYEKAGVPTKAVHSFEEALIQAVENIKEQTAICIFGSLYLTGEIYGKMTQGK